MKRWPVAGLLLGALPLAGLAQEPRPLSPEAFDKRIRDQVEVFTQFARSAGIRAE